MSWSKVSENLSRWTAAHPAWNPNQNNPGDGWGEQVGCLRLDTPSERCILDPLLPPEGSAEALQLWTHLEAGLENRSVSVVVVNCFHSRSAARVAQRFGASIWGPAEAKSHLERNGCSITRGYTAGDALPGGLRAYAIQGLFPGEFVLHAPAERALIFADAVLGAEEGGIRLPHHGWGPDPDATWAQLRRSLRPLLELDFERLLVSHGEPILTGGKSRLQALLDVA